MLSVFDDVSSAWVRRGFVLSSTAAVLAIGILHAWTPPSDLVWSVCFFRRATGISCPGCGLTRAFAALAKGDLAAALTLHPLAPIFALEALVAWAAWGRVVLGRRQAALPWRALNATLLADAVALLALWCVRLATGTLPR